MTTKRRARALLIGVETYTHLGPDKQLRAGRNDVLAFWKVCRRLGFLPENIHIFTSPVLEVDDLVWAEQELRDELEEYQGKTEEQIGDRVRAWFALNDVPRVFCAEATRDAIVGPNGLQWIAQRVAAAGEPPVDRILTYSGHGTTIDQDGASALALCPADLVQGKSETYISIHALEQELKDADDNLTVVLDCCFAQTAETPRSTHRVATLSNRTADKPLAIDASGIAARVFCASGPNESSYQALLGGYWYSAFTWAMTVALEQWRICRKHKAHSTISHAELLFRARLLLEALSFPQHPVLLDKIGNKAVFGHMAAEETTTLEPNEERRGGQIDPSGKDYAYYQLKDGDKILLDIIVTNGSRNAKYGFEKGQEYWRIRTDAGVDGWGNYAGGNGYSTDAFVTTTFVKQACDWPADNSRMQFQEREKSFVLSETPADNWSASATDADFQFHDSMGYGLRVNVWMNNGKWAGEIQFVRSDAATSPLFAGDNRTFALKGSSQLKEKRFTKQTPP